MAEGLEGLLTGHTLVKRYKIEEVIGRGGFAVVYRATDGRLGRPVAVKVITLTAEDPEQRELLRERLHREARAAASLPHHPNLVTVHDVGTDPELGLDFLVMEMLKGENLAQALGRDGRPPLDRALCILRDAGEGLAVGHRAGLVHRDVKPGNIFLAHPHDDDPDNFRVCVLDYGIALAIEDDQTVTRGMGANPLSPAYASPEQLRGARDLTAATDVFSLGVVGYQILTGERPFTTEPGQAPTGWTVRKPITDLNPEVPLAVEAVVMRAMSEDPRERFPDADAFVDALEVATREDDITQVLAAKVAAPGISAVVLDDGIDVVEDDATMVAPPPRPAVAAPAKAVPHARPVPPLRVPAPPRKRSKMPIVLVLALLLVAAAAWAAMSGRGGGGDDGTDALRPTAEGDSVVLDEAGQPVEETVVDRGDPTSEQPIESRDLDPGATGTGGDPSVSQPSQPRPSPSGVPAVITPGRPNPQPQQPQQPQQPGAQPQPQRPAPPSAQPPAQQPQQPRPPAQQPSRPPAQQPTQPQPQPQQPARPPAQQPTQPQPQQPTQPQPRPQQPTRPDPPLLGRPVEPAPPPPRDTLFFPATPPR